MTCHPINLPMPDGTVATGILCMRGKRRPTCKACGTRNSADKQCDFPVVKPGRKSKTCDVHICSKCAVHVGEDKDYCPAHARHQARLDAAGEAMRGPVGEHLESRRSSEAGLFFVPAFLTLHEVNTVIDEARWIVRAAPLRTPTMPDGRPLHLRVTNAGAWGWWSDRDGYRYIDRHPTTGKPWPPIPAPLLAICERALASCGLPTMRVDNLLVNFYSEAGSLGMHVDKTEDDRDAPIVSISVGADAIFAMGGLDRNSKAKNYLVTSGTLIIQSGPSRRHFHGITKILPTMTSPIPGRVNLTFRKVKTP